MADYRDDPRWKEYGFGRGMFPTVASSEYTTISHPGTAERYADTLSPERLAEITATIAPKVDTFEAHPDVKLDRWATEGVPGPGSAIHDYDPRTDTTIISPPTLTIPEVDTFKELSPEERAAAKRAETVEVDPLAGYDAYEHALEADKFLGKGYWAAYSPSDDPGKKYLYSSGGGYESLFEGGTPFGFYGHGKPGEPLSSGMYIPSYYAEDYYKLPKETLEGIFSSLPFRGTAALSDTTDPERVDMAGLLAAIGNKDIVAKAWGDEHWTPSHIGSSVGPLTTRPTYDLFAPEPVSDYYKDILVEKDFKTSPHFGGPALSPEVLAEIAAVSTLDERLDVPDVRIADTGEAVSPSFLDSIISPAEAGSMTPGRGSAAKEWDTLDKIRKEEAEDAARAARYSATLGKWGMSGGEFYEGSPGITSSTPDELVRAAKIAMGEPVMDLTYRDTILGDTGGEEYRDPGAAFEGIPGVGDWESIIPDTDPYFKLADTKEADYVLGGDPYYGRRPGMVGRTPPIPEPTGPPSWFPSLETDLLDALPVSPYLGGVGTAPTPPSWFPSLTPDLLDSASPYGYTPPRTTPTAPVAPSWFPSLETDLLDSARPYGHIPTPTTPVPSSWFPLLETDSLDSASSFYPPGYSPITGTFYPTAAEILAAGGTTP